MKAKCPIDGVEFEVHSYQHKYCSDRCRLIAFHLNKYREMQEANGVAIVSQDREVAA
jgi:endogenous inhibitor of DNA gyrase (YacG/DUF329 family)